jgi:hypothetical protein
MALENMDFALSFRLLDFVPYCLGKIMNVIIIYVTVLLTILNNRSESCSLLLIIKNERIT